tara:strand:+ start:257 stop:1621 length:1365 start_codon:yes stop_codon:yes gene_type:complete
MLFPVDEFRPAIPHRRLAFLPMPRMKVQLTSARDDGDWTWRAEGARQPKGSIDRNLVPDGAVVGDVLRVEVDQFMDGIEVTSVLQGQADRSGAETLEIIGSGRNEPLVTTKLAGGRGRRGDDDRRDGRREGGRGQRRDGDGRQKRDGAGRGDRARGPRDAADRKDGDKQRGRKGTRRDGDSRGSRTEQRTRPSATADTKTRAPRLRPRRIHRKAAIAALPDDQRRLAQILVRDGVPGLRTAIEAQNKAAEAADQPGIPADLLLKLAEQIHPALRSADWQDRAEAALAGVGDVDLRDLRSVVVAADSAFRTDANRALADQLREALTARLEREQQAWQAEVASAMDEDRIVRALRLSSRPPKAGAPLPGPVLDRLATMADASLTSETGQDRWATLLDAVALSPVHLRVVPAGLPAEPGDQLLDVVKRVSMGVPAIAAAFGIEPTAPPRSRRGRPRG